jgi:superfamily I DNA/RNA helicase
VLTRGKRDAIWPVFEDYRAAITLRKLKEVDDAYRDAASLLKAHPTSYASIVVDETQDFGPQALKLLRAMVEPGKNDLCFVGDGHQRIYNHHLASMSSCGIDIRGRGRKLYLNYRTTEEIRRAAVALLEGCEVDDLDDLERLRGFVRHTEAGDHEVRGRLEPEAAGQARGEGVAEGGHRDLLGNGRTGQAQGSEEESATHGVLETERWKKPR